MRLRSYQIVFAAVAALLILNSGQALALKWGRGVKGSGDMETRELDLDRFEKIDLRGAFDIDITIGDEQKVEVTIDDNLWDILVAEVDGRTLELGWDENCRPDEDCRVEIVVKKLTDLDLSGAGDVDIENFRGSEFSFHLSGAGDLTMDGEVDDLEIRVSGAGNVDTRELKARDVDVSISGAGNADVYASNSIRGRVSGVGNLEYWGDPEVKSTHVSGLGHIERR